MKGSTHSLVRFSRQRGALGTQKTRPVCNFRKACRSRFISYSPAAQRHPKTSRTCFEGPFGEVLRATGPMAKANPIRFSTQYTDDETDLVSYLYRYYSPSTGRWLSRDPIEENAFRNIFRVNGSDHSLVRPIQRGGAQ